MRRTTVEFKAFGDWKGVRRILNSIPRELNSSSLWGQRKAAEQLIKIVKGHLNRQDLNWAPLSKATVKRKGHKRILIDTYSYYTAIETWQSNKERFVGVKNGRVNNKGKSIAYIAQIHEYKSYNGGPYRALWGPSVKEMGGPEGIANIISKVIYNKLTKLRSKGIEVTWQRS